jgi:hypothetical protein
VACCSVAGSSGAGVCDLWVEGGASIGSRSRSQQLVYCTSGSTIGVLRDAAAGAGRLLSQEPAAAVRACCLGAAGLCTQLFCATGQGGLVLMSNAL